MTVARPVFAPVFASAPAELHCAALISLGIRSALRVFPSIQLQRMNAAHRCIAPTCACVASTHANVVSPFQAHGIRASAGDRNAFRCVAKKLLNSINELGETARKRCRYHYQHRAIASGVLFIFGRNLPEVSESRPPELMWGGARVSEAGIGSGATVRETEPRHRGVTMSKAAEAFRTISEVADELDVQKHVLRFWEARFPQVRPMKRGGGRRYYRSGRHGIAAWHPSFAAR